MQRWLWPHKQVLKSPPISDCGRNQRASKGLRGDPHKRQQVIAVAVIVALQSVAALFFAFDSISDLVELGRAPMTTELVLEGMVTLSLVAGIVLGLAYVHRLRADLQRQATALTIARGALAEHVRMRFEQWGLSAAEADVALLVIKGFQIAEIARLRGAAAGTIRSQMSQVYAKAGVSSQSMLVASFLDDLLDGERAGTKPGNNGGVE